MAKISSRWRSSGPYSWSRVTRSASGSGGLQRGEQRIGDREQVHAEFGAQIGQLLTDFRIPDRVTSRNSEIPPSRRTHFQHWLDDLAGLDIVERLTDVIETIGRDETVEGKRPCVQ